MNGNPTELTKLSALLIRYYPSNERIDVLVQQVGGATENVTRRASPKDHLYSSLAYLYSKPDCLMRLGWVVRHYDVSYWTADMSALVSELLVAGVRDGTITWPETALPLAEMAHSLASVYPSREQVLGVGREAELSNAELEEQVAWYDDDAERVWRSLLVVAAMRQKIDAVLGHVSRDQPTNHTIQELMLKSKGQAEPPKTTIPSEVSVTPHPADPRTQGSWWRQRRRLLVTAAAVAAVIAVTAIMLVVLPGIDGSGDPDNQTTTTAPVSLQWQPAPDLLEPLEAAGIAVLDGKVWVVGGNSADSDRHALGTVQIYDPARPTDGWQPGTPLEEGLDGAAVASDGDRLYVVGGRTGQKSNWEYRAEMYVLDGADDTKWDRLESSLPEPRYAGAVVWDGSRLVFAGGSTEAGAKADVWGWERGGQWLPVGHGKLTQPRDDLAVATDGDGRVWFLGGNGPAGRHLDTVDRIERDNVEADSDIHIPPVRASAAVWLPERGGCLLGGAVPEGETDAVTCFESGVPPLPGLLSPRAGAAAVRLGNTIYVAGGFGSGESGMSRVDKLVIP